MNGTTPVDVRALFRTGVPFGLMCERSWPTPPLRFMTASLHVDFLRPTPIGVPLEVRGRVEEVKGRKVVVSATVSAKGEVCAKGQVVTVQMPEHLMPKKDPV